MDDGHDSGEMKDMVVRRFGLAARSALGVLAIAALVVSAQAAPRRSAAPTYPAQPKPDGATLQEYEAQFPTKQNWNLSDINGKSPPGEATLTLDENYRGTGASGCNTWSAALYPQKGKRLAMGPIAQTKKACAADIMQFENQYLAILHSGPSWDQTGYTLTVKSQGGTLTFKRGL